MYDGNPIAGVQVSIDDQFNWSTETDEKGYFILSDVSAGEHELVLVKSFSATNSSGRNSEASSPFTEKRYNITVTDDIDFEQLRLPNGVVMYPAAEITPFGMKISWSPTDAEDFVEYKVFSHNSSGLDETTGTLIHVSTSVNDTTFVVDDLSPLQTIFYRVYVMNEFGRMGGSNITEETTSAAEMVVNEVSNKRMEVSRLAGRLAITGKF